MSFIMPPFWSSRLSVASHAVSVLVTPAVAISSSSIAASTVLTSATQHGFATGDTIALAGHTGSTPALDGSHFVSVLSPTTFSVPVTVTVAGAGGTATRTHAVEPLSLEEAKARARITSPHEDALVTDYIRAARARVELDTGLALLAQTRDISFDAITGAVLTLPAHSTPLQAVLSITSTDTAGVAAVLDPAQYVVDLVGRRVGLAYDGTWPTDLRPFQPFVIRIVSGWSSAALIPPLLVHAVGLLVTHYATLGRDLASFDPATEVPMGYTNAISDYVPVIVA